MFRDWPRSVQCFHQKYPPSAVCYWCPSPVAHCLSTCWLPELSIMFFFQVQAVSVTSWRALAFHYFSFLSLQSSSPLKFQNCRRIFSRPSDMIICALLALQICSFNPCILEYLQVPFCSSFDPVG